MMAEAAQTTLLCLESVADYEKLHRIGEGTYGVVYKARHRSTGQIVALKKVRFDRSRDGVPVTSIRELRTLQECSHPNIVRLIKVVTGSKADSVFLVFEYCDCDLGRVLDLQTQPFTLPQIKRLVLQLLEAVACLHQHWVLHRDIKMSNLLYCRNGQLKLCDLGLARYYQHQATAMTPRVVTLWYRAPELLLGSEMYDEGVDMWAVGCVLGELLLQRPLFPAKSEVEALRMQVDLLGTPTQHTWPDMASLPQASMIKLPIQPECRLHSITAPFNPRLHRGAATDPGKHRHSHSHHVHTSDAAHRGSRRHGDRGHDSDGGDDVGHRGRTRYEHSRRDRSPAVDDRQGDDRWRMAGSTSPSDDSQPRHRGRSAPRDDVRPRRSGSAARHRRTSRSRSRDRSSRHRHRSVSEQRLHSPPPTGNRDLALDLLSSLLAWAPERRLSAKQALHHPWFKELPLACQLYDMPSAPIPDDEKHQGKGQKNQGHHPHHSGFKLDRTADQQRRFGDAFDNQGGAGQVRHVVLRR